MIFTREKKGLSNIAMTIVDEEEKPSDVIKLKHLDLGIELELPKNIEPERLESLIKTLNKIKPSTKKLRNISMTVF